MLCGCDVKLGMAYLSPIMVDCGTDMFSCCTADPVVHLAGAADATQCAAVLLAHTCQISAS